jgi:hypothetical protein
VATIATFHAYEVDGQGPPTHWTSYCQRHGIAPEQYGNNHCAQREADMTQPEFGQDPVSGTPSTSRPTRDTRRVRLLAWAGIIYVLAWLVGLFLAPSAPDPSASAATVNDYFVAHRSAALLQALFVHGLAGIALAVFAFALWGYLTAERSRSAPAPLMLGFALLAAAASLVQFALAIATYTHVGGHGSASGTRALFNAINKADTIKLVLLAIFIGAATVAARRLQAFPRWVLWEGIVTVPFLVIGGLAFVIDAGVLNLFLGLSLLLLLLWAAAASITILRGAAPRQVTMPLTYRGGGSRTASGNERGEQLVLGRWRWSRRLYPQGRAARRADGPCTTWARTRSPGCAVVLGRV